MAQNNIPDTLRLRAKKYCFFLRKVGKQMETDGLLDHLSQSLRDELRLHIHQEKLESIPCFQDAPKPFLSLVCELMQHHVHGPQDIIMDTGDFVQQFYVIEEGRVQSEYYYLGSYLVVDRILCENNFFGIRSLMTSDPLSDNTFRCLTFVKLLVMDSEPLRIALQSFAPLRKYVNSIVIRYLWRMVLRTGKAASRLGTLEEREATNRAIGQANADIADDTAGSTSYHESDSSDYDLESKVRSFEDQSNESSVRFVDEPQEKINRRRSSPIMSPIIRDQPIREPIIREERIEKHNARMAMSTLMAEGRVATSEQTMKLLVGKVHTMDARIKQLDGMDAKLDVILGMLKGGGRRNSMRGSQRVNGSGGDAGSSLRTVSRMLKNENARGSTRSSIHE